jgi:hypothetical protein
MILMNNAQIYDMIPYQLLERVGFPSTYINLTLDQKAFIDDVFANNSEIALANLHLMDRVTELEDKVADLEYELKDLAGEK